MEAPYLNEKQVSTYTGIKISTLQTWRFQGRGIPYIKAGRKVIYKKSDVDAYLEGKRVAVDETI